MITVQLWLKGPDKLTTTHHYVFTTEEFARLTASFENYARHGQKPGDAHVFACKSDGSDEETRICVHWPDVAFIG